MSESVWQEEPSASSIATFAGALLTESDRAVLPQIIWKLSTAVFWLISFISYTLPSWVIALLGLKFSITLSFSSIVIILGVLIGIIYGYIRYRYLTVYSRLPKEVHRREPKLDLFQETQNDNTQKRFSTYLDEFLSAIKVFGYLERPVFHELTRHMQTCKLTAGDTMEMDKESGFCIVVDGAVEIYVRSDKRNQPPSDKEKVDLSSSDDYQLLTEVRNGTPMSSLFSIISLFTESSKDSPKTFSSMKGSPAFNGREAPEDGAKDIETLHDLSGYQSPQPANGQKQEIIGHARIDSTIAIIPAQAFRRLSKVYPKAVAHIVQVILTRFERVTFQTGHYYLGLTDEILKPEMLLNQQAKHELPHILPDGSIERLKDRFKQQQEEEKDRVTDSEEDDDSDYFMLETPTPKSKLVQGSTELSRQIFLDSRSTKHPGDLISNVSLLRDTDVSTVDTDQEDDGISRPLSRSTGSRAFLDIESEDSAMRRAIVRCICSALGIDDISSRSETVSIAGNHATSPVGESDYFNAKHRTSFSSLGGSNILSSGFFETAASVTDDDSSVSTSAANMHSLEVVQGELLHDLELVYYKAGTTIVEEDGKNPGLFYVIDGFIEVSYTDKLVRKKRSVYTIGPGGIGGYLGTTPGYKSFVTLEAKTPLYVGYLRRDVMERILEKHPPVLLCIAKKLTNRLPKLILHLDFALEWVQLDAGKVLYHHGDQADAIYIVLNGRIRSTTETSKGKHYDEYGQGESVGELEVLTMTNYESTLHAIRDTELAKIPRTLFESLSLKYPSITVQIAKIMASRIRKLADPSEPHDYRLLPHQGSTKVNETSHYRTVAVVPTTEGLPVAEFGRRLFTAFEQIDQNAICLNQASILTQLGRHAFNKIGRLKFSGYLADLEERYQTVLYLADSSASSPWTQTCISQADCILLIAAAESDPSIGEYEQLLLGMKTTARKDLVLIHPEKYVQPGSTNQWLQNRIWINSYIHVQMDFRAPQAPVTNISALNRRISNIRNKVQILQSGISRYALRRGRQHHIGNFSSTNKNDFCRLARILCGRAIGLVLGGGGARGISHLGVIRAIEEAGIPVDLIGGTSIGAFVGGLYARDADLVPIYARTKQFAGRIGSLWRMALDLTYPATSYTTGHEFNRGVWKAFGDNKIEDFWIRFFTNTTNITHSRMEIHTEGYAWRYVRASMSLAGLLPPITDQGSMLLDGGYVDNLPVHEMKRQGAEVIFAVDVGSVDDTTPMTYGDSLSGMWVLFNRWNIFSRQPNVPSLAEIQARLAYVSSVGALEKAKQTDGCVYLRPPIDHFATLDFGKFEDIYRIGYEYGKSFFENIKSSGNLPDIAGYVSNQTKGKSRKSFTRRNSV